MHELAPLLGFSHGYVRQLVKPLALRSGSGLYGGMAFPQPRFVFSSGIRVWFVDDLERWALEARRRRVFDSGFAAILLDRRELADRLLGRTRS